MSFNTQSFRYEQLPSDVLRHLFEKKIDLVQIHDVFPKEIISSVAKNVELKIMNDYKFQLPDGFFYPMPYSAVHVHEGDDKLKLANTYWEAAQHFNANIQNIIGEKVYAILYELLHKIQIDKDDLLFPSDNKSFTSFNIRLLEAGKNGIYIHCENSFISELEPGFRQSLTTQIDLEQALSLVVFIQAPDEGGELFLFDTDWDTTPIHLNESSRDIRHIKQGVFFTHHGYPKPQEKAIVAQSGDVIIFRAAQIWHTVNSIGGKNNRLSLGCFIGQTQNGSYKFWA